MRSFKSLPASSKVFAAVLAVILATTLRVERGRAADERKNLQLEVIINDVPINMIGSFVALEDNRIAATADELKSLGLEPAPGRAPNEMVTLDDIPTLKYQYDAQGQRILITVDDVGRKAQTFDLSNTPERRLVKAQAGWGALMNYDLLSSTSNLQNIRSFSVATTSLSLAARAFSPYGTLEQSAIVQSGPQQSANIIRLNSSFRYSDQDSLITYGAGDTINGGLPWTRPIRIGGLQAQSNFALRPDLITVPLPTLGGSAAVPSTVDVYVNNIKTFSQSVGTGPFSITNVPLVSGNGNAELVIRNFGGARNKVDHAVLFIGKPACTRVDELVVGSRAAAVVVWLDGRRLRRIAGWLGNFAPRNIRRVDGRDPCRGRSRCREWRRRRRLYDGNVWGRRRRGIGQHWQRSQGPASLWLV